MGQGRVTPAVHREPPARQALAAVRLEPALEVQREVAPAVPRERALAVQRALAAVRPEQALP